MTLQVESKYVVCSNGAEEKVVSIYDLLHEAGRIAGVPLVPCFGSHVAVCYRKPKRLPEKGFLLFR